MAWNQPSGKTRVDAKKSKGMSWTVVAVAVLAVAGGAWWLLSSDATEPSVPSVDEPVHIPPSASVKAPSPVQKDVPAETVEKPKVHYWERATTNGLSECQQLKWLHKRLPPPARTSYVLQNREKAYYEIFDHKSENEIAALITLPPGGGIVGAYDYGKEFLDDFVESLETPIDVLETDSEEDAALKRDMIEVKRDLKKRMDAGEDVCKIMAEAREEAMRLSVYTKQIEEMVQSAIHESADTIEDAEDIIGAANRMLEERGASPIKISPVLKSMLKRQIMNKKAKGNTK